MGLFDWFNKKQPVVSLEPFHLLGRSVMGLEPLSARRDLKALARADPSVSVDFAGGGPARITIALASSECVVHIFPLTEPDVVHEKKLSETTALDVWSALPGASSWRGDDAIVEVAIPHGDVTKFLVFSRATGLLMRAFVEETPQLEGYTAHAQLPEFGAHRKLTVVAPEGVTHTQEDIMAAFARCELQPVGAQGASDFFAWYSALLGFDEVVEVAFFWSAAERIIVTTDGDVLMAGTEPGFKDSLHGARAISDLTTMIMQLVEGKEPSVDERGTLLHRAPNVDMALRSYKRADGKPDMERASGDVTTAYVETAAHPMDLDVIAGD